MQITVLVLWYQCYLSITLLPVGNWNTFHFRQQPESQSGRILQKISSGPVKERRNHMSSNYQQKKMMNALGAIDTKGNIVLEQFQDGTALPAEQRAAVLRGYRL